MKKILSMVLCILMVMSVFAIPMTVSATTASETVFDPTTTMNYVVDYDGLEPCRYEWTPASDGVLTLEADPGCTDLRVVVENRVNAFTDYVAFEYCPAQGFSDAKATYNVKAGTVYDVMIETFTQDAGTADFWAYFEAGAAGGITGTGSMMDPYQISETTEALPEIASGETAYFQLSVSDLTKTYNLMFVGSMMGSYEVNLNRTPYYPMMMGRTTIENIVPDMYWGVISFIVTNTGRGPETLGFSVTANEASTLGTMDDPDTLVFDILTTASISGGSYFYTASIDEDATLSIEFKVVNDWMCTIYGGEAELVSASSNDDPATNPVTYPVKAGETITVIVSNNDLEACELYFEATLVTGDEIPDDNDDPVGPEHTYNVAGVEALCGVNWDPAQNQMMYFGDGTWSITFDNVPAGNHEFKVVEDGAWGGNDYNLQGNAAGGGGNAVVTVEVDGSTVSIGFDGEKAYIEGVFAPEVDDSDVDDATKDEATKDEPVVDDATKDEATKDEPVVDDATKDEATKDEATKDEATKDEATKDEATKDEATKDEFDLGDVNRDGKLSIQDATLIQKYLAKISTLDEEQLAIADYNGDGRISIQDATMIQKKLAHLI